MNDLILSSEGVKGGGVKEVKKGWVALRYGQNFVEVDNFEGFGNTYKQREQPRIYIKIDGERYVFNFNSLKKQLDKK